jgi:hypothetical protein
VNRVFGVLLVIAAVAVGVLPSAPADAATTATSHQMVCGFATTPTWNPDSDFATSVVFDHPASVAPNEAFTISIDFNPMKNGPIGLDPGVASINAILDVSGDAATAGAGQNTSISKNTVRVEPEEEFDIAPMSLPITAGASGSITVTLDKTILSALGANLSCFTFNGGGTPTNPSIAIPISDTPPETTTTTEGPPGQTTTTTEGSGTTTTTEAPTTTSSSTTTPSTTTTTVPESTTTTVPPTTTSTTIAKADTISASKSVSYACTPVVSGSTLGTETATQTVTISAPDRVNTGDEFSVAMKMSPGPANGPIPLDPGNVDPTGTVKVTGGSPSTLKVYGSTNSSVIAARGTITVPTMRGTVKATGSVGDTISYAPGTFTFNSPLLNAVTTCEPSSTVQVLSTQIVAEQIDVAAGQSSLPSTGIEEPATKAWVSALLLYAGFLFITALPRGWRLPGAKGDAS